MYFPISALLIEYLILTIVDTQDSYGYEISQTIKMVADIKESTLYPILKKLEKASQHIRRSIRDVSGNIIPLRKVEKNRCNISIKNGCLTEILLMGL